MRPLCFFLVLVALPALAELPHRTLPEGVHATRIQAGTIYRVLQVKETGSDGMEVVKYVTDDTPTQVPDGWYFTNTGYERLLMTTTELQLNIQKLQVATAQPPPLVFAPPDVRLGFSAQTVAAAGLVGLLIGAGAVMLLAGNRARSETAHPASNVIPLPGIAIRR